MSHPTIPLPTSLMSPLPTSPCPLHAPGTYHLPSCEIIGSVLLSHRHLECQVMTSFLICHPANPCLSFKTQIPLPCVWLGSRWCLTSQAGGVAPPRCSLYAHSISSTALISMLPKRIDSLPASLIACEPFEGNAISIELSIPRACHIMGNQKSHGALNQRFFKMPL